MHHRSVLGQLDSSGQRGSPEGQVGAAAGRCNLIHVAHEEVIGGPAERTQLSEQLRRERLLDMEGRLRPYRRRALLVLAAGLVASGAWIGWWWLIPLAAAAAAFGASDRLMTASARPELWAAAGWAIAPLMIAVSVALTGGPSSPGVAWFALPAVTLGARFERRGVLQGLAYTTALMLLSTIPLDPAKVAAAPQCVIFPLALTLGSAILSGAVVQSDREHRMGAVIDPLTGLLNRAALAQRFAELEQLARQSGGAATVGFLVGDLDNFKRINDEHGHVIGDAVLRDAAYAMRNSLRAFDLVYRIGGEEFVVVLPGASVRKAHEIAERLRAAVAASGPRGVDVSISFGAAAGSGDRVSFGALYESADRALYAAKEAGRDRVVVADPGAAAPGARPAAAMA